MVVVSHPSFVVAKDGVLSGEDLVNMPVQYTASLMAVKMTVFRRKIDIFLMLLEKIHFGYT